MRYFMSMLLFCVAINFFAGCTVVDTMQGMASRTVGALSPESSVGWDPGSETGDPWIQEAGAEARGHRPVQHEADPLGLRKYYMSDRARDIERNLGIE